ncbi:TetR/AcrR family transcriptional regulator [Ornithinicoccus hortensis]|uniref:TetR family transcriptional regulator n=1 Tax=Ornithinicoccus hortensis TaxID=82346 RepID=A0A542YPY1_9MICO|nr:TetR/AcrR family transcriptional regulator [Ornithinicoccus hortensis]TQL50162.1 TetR family transcriptional regulator [Ornithinicoccus hortensis]
MSRPISTTRRRMNRTERRAQLLQAAQESFVHKGYHATAMDDIAERAGVSKPVLYQHFASKQDLYLGLVDLQADRLVALVRAALDSTSDNAERVAACVGAYFEFVDHDPGYRLIFDSDQSSDPEVRSRLTRVVEACAGAVAGTIQEDTGLPGEQAALLGTACIGLAQSCAERWVAEGRPVAREQAADLVAQVAWRGLGAMPLIRAEGSAG